MSALLNIKFRIFLSFQDKSELVARCLEEKRDVTLDGHHNRPEAPSGGVMLFDLY